MWMMENQVTLPCQPDPKVSFPLIKGLLAFVVWLRCSWIVESQLRSLLAAGRLQESHCVILGRNRGLCLLLWLLIVKEGFAGLSDLA